MNLDATKLSELDAFMAETAHKTNSHSYVIAVLHKAQQLFGYLPREAMDYIAHAMNIPTAHIWGVATFYHFFNLKPVGKHPVSVCMGTACYVKGAKLVLDAIKEELRITIGETTEDGIFTLQETRCIGACGLAPVMMVGDKIYGDITPKKAVKVLAQIRKETV
ncbi:MAG: hypothetical protein A2487_07455 [Candidatus Raymondbacteria bacterium RifOxyC12_full_50_8]|uniref:NADH dehydrogenase n=1 Tax=Candidatus Raymondbacteria bacterium RIFOXYD12_FULL_49_13 TaxID=1817890 RepID=A0A1F7F9E5_UNCRA|nr:MAG: hypothetical protein A2350_06800 [Candidatus Raymondbacteria bacterium RifOxyB12_full_50_8]OGJ93216.1 MAG: hypothetical protein A2248_17760 [Candidatus Raymondbacteria bacterium RIFOXYA2_FULL_49_16]OGJ99435.1 MAG: hypothetical protein A2487_07455 [Candidatus Raymondbacteria bacterium RifOxyC12_full_50_8]OGK03299.1 MAG: hypothetical protein A2519_15105 [Candidatus Raymondbacteria bacterium RIFOXYD12_FULL_49_13]OGP44938.1 MAG: hypothetical protein A2324_19685 [Candidatus Raymondbacteria b